MMSIGILIKIIILYYRQGDILLVPFPFTNLTGSKRRPAIVVSNKLVNGSEDLVLAQITTTQINLDLACKITNNDVTKPFEPPYSEMYISCKKVAVIDKNLILKRITTISSLKLTETLEKIIKIFEQDSV
jgi:mRNA interferase MazF